MRKNELMHEFIILKSQNYKNTKIMNFKEIIQRKSDDFILVKRIDLSSDDIGDALFEDLELYLIKINKQISQENAKLRSRSAYEGLLTGVLFRQTSKTLIPFSMMQKRKSASNSLSQRI